MPRSIFRILFTILAATAISFSQENRLPAAKFPAAVRGVDGETIDVAALAKMHRLVVVTLKATWCEVCQRQLQRIKKKLPESKACGLSFLVLAPGPSRELKAIRGKIGFPFPFVEDKGLRIAASLGLRMGEDEILPAIFILREDLTVGWMQAGRGEGAYGDPALFAAAQCAEWI